MKTIIFTKTEYGRTVTSEAYVGPKGEYRWVSNNRPCPIDALQSYGVKVPSRQKEACDESNRAAIAEYRKQMENHQHTPEEIYEMKSAFGEDAVVVNAVTGKKTNLGDY